MKNIDFNFLLTNAAFPASVILTKTNLIVELRDVQCNFTLIENYFPVDLYKSESGTTVLEYSQIKETLSICFSLRDLSLKGKSQIHELPSTIEKQVNSLMFHAKSLSCQIESIVLSLQPIHGYKIRQLSHRTAVIVLPTKTYGEIEMCTTEKSESSITLTSPLLTTRLFEYYFDLNKPLNLVEMFENLSISAEFQLILNEVFKEFASKARRSYVDKSYSMYGLTCTANYYNEVHLCYMKDVVIKIRVKSFPYTLEILDLGCFNKNLLKVRKFENCLHHAVSKALKDPSLSGFNNTVDVNTEAGNFIILELHKAEHVKNTLLLMVSYIQLTHLFEKVRVTFDEHFRVKGGSVFSYIMLDLKANLVSINEFRFNFVLKMKNIGSLLEIDIEIDPKPRREAEAPLLEDMKSTLISYFNTSVKEYYKGNIDIILGFLKVFALNYYFFSHIKEILDEEIRDGKKVEMIWPYFVVKDDFCRLSVRIWNTCGRHTDIVFTLKINKNGEIEMNTDLDANFLVMNNVNCCNPIEVIRKAKMKRADELRTRQMSEVNS